MQRCESCFYLVCSVVSFFWGAWCGDGRRWLGFVCGVWGIFFLPPCILELSLYHIALSDGETWTCFFKRPTWIIKQIKEQISLLSPQDHCHLCTCNSKNENAGYLCCAFRLLDLKRVDLIFIALLPKQWGFFPSLHLPPPPVNPITEWLRRRSVTGMKQLLASCRPLTWLFFGHVRQALVIDNDAN